MVWFKERLVLLVISVGLLLALFSVKLIQNPYEYKDSTSSRNQSQLTISDKHPKSVTVASPFIHKPVANPKPERDEWRSEHDLEAQTNMAKWARYMVYVSAVMAVLSAAGIWLIYATLSATRLGTESMQKALEETKRATRLEMQPYLSCSKISIKENVRVEGREVQTYQIVTIKNNGKTPAYISGSCNTVIASLKSVNPWPKSKDTRGRFPQSWYIPPNGEKNLSMYAIYEFERFNGDNIKISELGINGKIEIFYTDEFTTKGRELIAAFDYCTEDDLCFEDGFAKLIVGSSYSITKQNKLREEITA
jgi:hypothetical protein